MIDMSVFNTDYSFVRNDEFFKFFGYFPYHDNYHFGQDRIFYNDPYRLY